MSLDAAVPGNDVTTLAQYATLLRETRTEINSILDSLGSVDTNNELLDQALADIADLTTEIQAFNLADYDALIASFRSQVTSLATTLNAVIGDLGSTITLQSSVALIEGTETLTHGDGGDLRSLGIEFVSITGAGACSISNITGGTAGQIKIFLFGDSNITIVSGGNIELNRTGNFTGSDGKLLVLINKDGDPDESEEGTWHELITSDIIPDDGVAITAAGKILIACASAAAQLQALGITASAAELNILNGATLETSELNFLDGINVLVSDLNTQITSLVSSAVAEEDLIKLHAITEAAADINTQVAALKASSVTQEDLEKLHTITVSAATINTYVPPSRQVIAGTGLSGGGALSANRTLSHASHTGNVTGSTTLTIANGVVTQGRLKTSSGTVSKSDSGTTNYTLPGGEYGFYPRHYMTNNTTYDLKIWSGYGIGVGPASYLNTVSIALYSSAGGAIYVNQRYVTSSGEVFWIFLLRDKSTGIIKGAFQAPDHPCFGNGGDPLLTPHPFPGFDPLIDEIIVMNPAHIMVDEMKSMCVPKRQGDRHLDLLELILNNDTKCYEIDEASEVEYSKTPVTVGIVQNLNDKPLWLLDEAPIIHLQIPQPECVKVKQLVKRSTKTFSIS